MLTIASARAADLLLRQVRVVDPATGLDAYLDVSVRQGTIAAIGHHLSRTPDQRELDGAALGTGCALLPAFVDPHVHVRVPGNAEVEDIASATAAAARGGYCAIVSMPNTDPVVDTPEVLRSLQRQAGIDAVVSIGFAAAISTGQRGEQLTEMCELADAGAALFSDDGRPVRSAALLRRALQYQAVAGRPLALHNEEPDLSAGGVMHEGRISIELGFLGIPSASESLSVARDVRLAELECARIHLQHLSARESVDELAAAKARGARVTAEATPHHLLLTDESVRSFATCFKMNPPLRAPADRNALVAALADGTIDCVATDHAPHAREGKEQPFETAPFGVTGLETAFASLYTGLVVPGRLSLERLVAALSSGPAAVLGVPPPRIEVGASAQLVLVDLDATWAVDAADFASRSDNSPFLGRTLRGRTLLTVATGQVAYDATATQPLVGVEPALAGATTAGAVS